MSVLILDIETRPLRELWTPPRQLYRCQGCGEYVQPDHADGTGHTRAEHSPRCDGNRCASDCPIPVACGPVDRIGGRREEFPPPCFCEVVCIGALAIGGPPGYEVKKLGIVGERHGGYAGEAEMLAILDGVMGKPGVELVTWNGRRFDLPVLMARSLALGIPQPWYFNRKGMRYRFSEEGHLDLCDQVSDFGAGRFMKLDDLARACGIPGKGGLDGASVEALYLAGRIAEIRAYCLSDVVMTARLFARWLVLKGALGGEEFFGLDASLATLVDVEVPA